jgi:hypothetical protein
MPWRRPLEKRDDEEREGEMEREERWREMERNEKKI